jgi:short-subunit dehydrogenase
MERPVVVTGASRGIGKALALALARGGTPLVVCARSATEIDAIAKEVRTARVECQPVHADLATEAGRDALLAAGPGRIHGLVNSAGFGTAGFFADQNPARDRQMVRLNVEAVVDLTHAFLPRIDGGGFILNVASTAGFQPMPLFATYSASKAFVLSFSEALADELAQRRIHVMALCPGLVHTDFQTAAQARVAGTDADSVARFALRALRAGRRVAIHGARNNLLVQSERFAPRRVVVTMARKLMEPWVREQGPPAKRPS